MTEHGVIKFGDLENRPGHIAGLLREMPESTRFAECGTLLEKFGGSWTGLEDHFIDWEVRVGEARELVGLMRETLLGIAPEKIEPLTLQANRIEYLTQELHRAVERKGGVEDIDLINGDEAALAPRYPSMLGNIEFYGNTVLLAQGGAGKTMVAIASVLKAAQDGDWNAVYFNTELDIGELRGRVMRPVTRFVWGDALENVQWVSPNYGVTQAEISEVCVGALRRDRNLLVVLDSINTLAEFGADDGRMSDLNRLRDLYNWSTQVRKNTGGAVSFLILSELNGAGHLKGLKGFYSADVVIKIEHDEGEDAVIVHNQKSRSSRSNYSRRGARRWDLGVIEIDAEDV